MTKRVATSETFSPRHRRGVPGLDEVEFAGFVRRMQIRFEDNLQRYTPRLFTTDCGDDHSLFEMYLDGLPDHRQYHNCHCCRTFLTRYGSLVLVGDGGRLIPAVWDEQDAPAFYVSAVRALRNALTHARVTGVHYSAEPLYGQPVTGEWSHFAVTPPRPLRYQPTIYTAGQAMAEKLEDYRTMQRALAEFSPSLVREAVRVLEADVLYRNEKVLGPAQWLLQLHESLANLRGDVRNHVLWKAVATAPAGFCHPRSSMIGTLLDDLATGASFEEVAGRFKAKMHPLQYQRPQAAPSAGNIAAAEKLVEKLGLERSLHRRYARLDEVETFWRPRQAAQPSGTGVFGHLQPKGQRPAVGGVQLPKQTMTWEKFQRLVLPTADELELYVAGRNAYAGLVTAVYHDSPPILQWDLPERRNPVSWYLYAGGSTPAEWSLPHGQFVPVTALCVKPPQWGPDPRAFAHQGEGVFLLLEGARDRREAGNCLFPEILKSELRGVRSTIESYSKGAQLQGREQSSACGLLIRKGDNARCDLRLRVRAGDNWSEFTVDRFD